MQYIFILTENIIKNEEFSNLTVYGIEAVSKQGRVLKSYPDLFFDREEAVAFVELCNTEELMLVHLEDVVEDALAAQYSLYR